MKCVICSDECSGDLVEDGDIMCYDCYVTNVLGHRPPWLDVGHGEDLVITLRHLDVNNNNNDNGKTVNNMLHWTKEPVGIQIDTEVVDTEVVDTFLKQYLSGKQIKFTCSKCGGLGHSSKECKN